MRKTLISALFVVLGATMVVAQNTTTWIDPYDPDNPFLPGSMPGFVTNGMFVDEWDIIVRSPAELSNYEGYGIYTAYGNNELWDSGAAGLALNRFVNPFATTGLSTATPNIGSFLLGYTFPLLSLRAGVLGGFQPADRTNDLTIAAAGPFTGTANKWSWSESPTDQTNATVSTPDAIDFSEAWNVAFARHTDESRISAGVGLDLGVLGASFFANAPSTIRTLGGSYAYTYTHGTDTGVPTPTADKVTSRTVYVGLGTSGAPAVYPTAAAPWTIGVIAELPIKLATFPLPITAGLRMIVDPSDAPDALTQEPTSVAISTTQVGGVANTTNTLIMLFGDNSSADMLADARSAPDNGVDTNLTTAQLRALFDNVPNQSYALDAARYAARSVAVGVDVDVQPWFSINNLITARTKAGLGFQYTGGPGTVAGTRSATFSYNDGNAANDTVTYSASSYAPENVTSTNLNLEAGGLLIFSTPDGVLSLGSGIFYLPEFAGKTTARAEAKVVQRSGSYTDGAGTAGVGAAVLGTTEANINSGAAQGSYSVVATTTYAANEVESSTTHRFTIPVALKIDLSKARMSLFGGYQLAYAIRDTTTTTPAQTTATTTTISNPSGTAVSLNGVDPATATVAAVDTNTTTGSSRDSTVTLNEWTGEMNWMVRWLPVDSITVDFFGKMLMTALNQNILTFNPNTFLTNVGLSVSFRIK
jgi:hypothetical protein